MVEPPQTLPLVDFGPRGEVLVFHEHSTALEVMTIAKGISKVQRILAPKFSSPNGYDYRPRSGPMALLSKGNGDTLSIHDPVSYKCVASVTLDMVDVQGVKWSPSGDWLVLWETPSLGTKTAIYTADGNHYRTYTDSLESDFPSLGVNIVEWAPNTSFVALGKQNATIDILDCKKVCRTSSSGPVQSDEAVFIAVYPP